MNAIELAPRILFHSKRQAPGNAWIGKLNPLNRLTPGTLFDTLAHSADLLFDAMKTATSFSEVEMIQRSIKASSRGPGWVSGKSRMKTDD